MKLRYRPMQPGDILECVGVLAKHTVIGPRYGPTIGHLAEAWHRLLRSETTFATVFHAGDDERAPICLFGVSVVVHDDFVREIKKLPPFWVGPELTRRVIKGESPVLTDKQLREANSRDGMNLLIWEGCAMPGYEARSELPRHMMAALIEVHQGYLWKEIIAAHAESPERLRHTLNTGGFIWDPIAGCYTATVGKDPDEIVSTPHIVGLTRELERSRRGWSGSWVGALFDYHAPILGFNRSEQRVLSRALSGATDEQLAGMLGTSLPTVKKTWVSIYDRVEDRLPALIPDPLRIDTPGGSRGKEKRRGLLAYLREHSEELRPRLAEASQEFLLKHATLSVSDYRKRSVMFLLEQR
jgi:hypothetical protein